MRKEASKESINRLVTNCGDSILIHGQAVDDAMALYNLSIGRLKDPHYIDNEYFKKLKALLEVVLTYSFAEIEIATLLRACFKEETDSLYRKTVLLQLFRVISEATKALFGFGKDQPNASWRILGSFFDLTEYSKEVEEINSGLVELSEQVINKTARDISCHYDWDALAIAESYFSINDEDVVIQGLNKYGYIIERVSKVSKDLFKTLTPFGFKDGICGVDLPSLHNKDMIWRIERRILKQELVEAIKHSYPENTKRLDHSIGLCRCCRRMTSVAEEKGFSFERSESVQCYMKILNSVSLLLFMMNDALVAAMALTESESFWESRMNLKRLDISAYEALNKVVGFTEKSREKSLFNVIDRVIGELPSSLQVKYESLKSDSSTLVKRYGFNRMGRRNSFVHYRSKKKVWLQQAYNNLTAITVADALYRVLELRRITSEIVLFVNSFSDSYSTLQDSKFKSRVNKKFDELKENLSKSSSEESKAQGQLMLEEFRSRLLNLPFKRSET